jgi:hypothetical protein
MNTNKYKRKSEEYDNAGDYLKELGILDKLLSIDKNDFKGLMGHVLLNKSQNKEVNRIKNKLKNDEYLKKYKIKENDKLTELENENKLYIKKIKKLEIKFNILNNKKFKQDIKYIENLEKDNELQKQKITELENKNVLLNNRLSYLMEESEQEKKEIIEYDELKNIELFDFNEQFNL